MKALPRAVAMVDGSVACEKADRGGWRKGRRMPGFACQPGRDGVPARHPALEESMKEAGAGNKPGWTSCRGAPRPDTLF